MLQLYTAMVLINLKWRSSSFRLHQVFPTLMVQMIFFQIQQAPGPYFRKVGKSLAIITKILGVGPVKLLRMFNVFHSPYESIYQVFSYTFESGAVGQSFLEN